jgi:DNA-directed RNA polymerase specialized sigma24 family protein
MPPDQSDQSDQSDWFIELVQHDEEALHALVPQVYKELRRLAHYHRQSDRPDHTLESTARLHEAYIRLLGRQPVDLQNRGHFIAVASRLMRQGAELLALDDALNEMSKIDERQGKIVERRFFRGLSAPDISNVLGISRATATATARQLVSYYARCGKRHSHGHRTITVQV